MFLEVRKHPLVYIQHIAMDSKHVAPVSSNFRINLNLVAELSMYTIKEDKTKLDLSGMEIKVPRDSRVVHLEMSYTHASHKATTASNVVARINERYYYKLVFMPGAEDEYARIKTAINRLTAE
jgi:hypothetical protein